MLRVGYKIAVVLALIVVAPSFSKSQQPSTLASHGQPPPSEKQSKPTQNSNSNSENADKQSSSSLAIQGSKPSNPLYIEATCDDQDKNADCNKGWWQKVLTDPSASFAGVLALTSIFLLILNLAGIALTYCQGRLARAEFAATHRPRIRVRFFPELPMNPGKPIMVTYEVVNIGDVEAILTKHELSIYDFAIGETSNPVWGSEVSINKYHLKPGEISPRYQLCILVKSVGEIMVPINPEHIRDMRVRGFFEYSDASKVVRKTQFYRRYDRESFALRIVEKADSDYQYED